MRICRTIFSLLIALSVATLPAAGMTMRSAEPISKLEAMAMPDMAAPNVAAVDMDDCCPDSKAPCGMPIDQCPAYSCAQSAPISNVSAPQVIYPLTPADKMLALVYDAPPPETSSPPFRPPRI